MVRSTRSNSYKRTITTKTSIKNSKNPKKKEIVNSDSSNEGDGADSHVNSNVNEKYGTISYKNSKYEGKYIERKDPSNGKIKKIRSGTGTLSFKTGDEYIGEWKLNKFNGRGIYTFNDGTYYDGMWLNGVKHGKGVMKDLNFKYDGMFENGSKQGYGEMKFDNGEGSYKGEYKNSKRHGKGVYIWKDGTKYEGLFANGKRVGEGKEYYPNGNLKFKGIFKGGQRDSKGTEYNKNGNIRYIGTYFENQRDGLGTLYDDDGKKYSCTYSHGKKLNSRLLQDDDITTYIGDNDNKIDTSLYKGFGNKEEYEVEPKTREYYHEKIQRTTNTFGPPTEIIHVEKVIKKDDGKKYYIKESFKKVPKIVEEYQKQLIEQKNNPNYRPSDLFLKMAKKERQYRKGPPNKRFSNTKTNYSSYTSTTKNGKKRGKKRKLETSYEDYYDQEEIAPKRKKAKKNSGGGSRCSIM